MQSGLKNGMEGDYRNGAKIGGVYVGWRAKWSGGGIDVGEGLLFIRHGGGGGGEYD